MSVKFSAKFLLLIYIFFSSHLFCSDVSRTQVIMGTYISLTLKQEKEHYIEGSFDIFKEIESYISSYNPNATVYKLNQNREVSLDKYTQEALLLSNRYYTESDGYFDISANYKRNLKIDFGGMGKGYGVDKVNEYLLEHNVSYAIIAASGDIRCISPCKIEINNPFSKEALASFTTLHTNQGISTSGNYENYEVSLQNNHLINPKTAKPQINFISITLSGLIKSSDLDAYATAASVMPIEEAYAFLDSKKLAFIILQSDKKLIVSKNANLFFENLIIYYTQKKKP